MKKLLLLLCLIFPLDVSAQTDNKLSTYEQNIYGDKLWKLPREPYQSRYKADVFKAKVYNLPDSAIQNRFQTHSQWENQQKAVSDRAAQPWHPPSTQK